MRGEGTFSTATQAPSIFLRGEETGVLHQHHCLMFIFMCVCVCVCVCVCCFTQAEREFERTKASLTELDEGQEGRKLSKMLVLVRGHTHTHTHALSRPLFFFFREIDLFLAHLSVCSFTFA